MTRKSPGDQQAGGLPAADRAVQSEPQQLPERALLNPMASSPPGHLRDASCILISLRCILSLSPSKPKKIGSRPLTRQTMWEACQVLRELRGSL